MTKFYSIYAFIGGDWCEYNGIEYIEKEADKELRYLKKHSSSASLPTAGMRGFDTRRSDNVNRQTTRKTKEKPAKSVKYDGKCKENNKSAFYSE